MEVAVLKIFVASLYLSFVQYPLSNIQNPTSNRDATLKNVQDDKAFLLTSDLYFRDDYSPRTYSGLSYTNLISFTHTLPVITLFDRPRIS